MEEHQYLNEFRQIDAFEYVDAYNRASKVSPEKISDLLYHLNGRIQRLIERRESVPSSLLAAYRGYEDALAFKQNPAWFNQFSTELGNPYIVVLDQSK